MRTTFGIVGLAVFVAGAYFLNEATRTKDGKSVLHVARALEISVETTKPTQRDIIRTVQAPGEVEPFAEVDIASEVVAKILELPVKEGQTVEAGDLLCRLDDADYRARLLSAKANVAKLKSLIIQAEADVEKSERDYNREQGYLERGASSPDTVANFRTVLVQSRSLLEVRKQELIEAEANLQSAEEDLDRTVITAPISGVVSQLFAEQGEVVITGTMNNPGTRIMVVSDLSVMQVRCRVDETDAPLVKTGQNARIYLQSDTHRSIPGQVHRVATKGTKQVGRDVVTFETLVLITGDDPRVKPGMSANVEIEVARKDEALTIPVQAVVYRKRRDLPEEFVKIYDEQKKTTDSGAAQTAAEYIKLVFCIADGVAHPRLVETGISDVSSVEVTNGVEIGDEIVTGPYRSLDQLKEDSVVKVLEKPGEATKPDGEAAEPDKLANSDGENAATSQPASQPTPLAKGDDEPELADGG